MTADEVAIYDLVFTSYATLARAMRSCSRGVEWAVVIADEAQHVKNRRTHAARALAGACARGRGSP